MLIRAKNLNPGTIRRYEDYLKEYYHDERDPNLENFTLKSPSLSICSTVPTFPNVCCKGKQGNLLANYHIMRKEISIKLIIKAISLLKCLLGLHGKQINAAFQ